MIEEIASQVTIALVVSPPLQLLHLAQLAKFAQSSVLWVLTVHLEATLHFCAQWVSSKTKQVSLVARIAQLESTAITMAL